MILNPKSPISTANQVNPTKNHRTIIKKKTITTVNPPSQRSVRNVRNGLTLTVRLKAIPINKKLINFLGMSNAEKNRAERQYEKAMKEFNLAIKQKKRQNERQNAKKNY